MREREKDREIEREKKRERERDRLNALELGRTDVSLPSNFPIAHPYKNVHCTRARRRVHILSRRPFGGLRHPKNRVSRRPRSVPPPRSDDNNVDPADDRNKFETLIVKMNSSRMRKNMHRLSRSPETSSYRFGWFLIFTFRIKYNNMQMHLLNPVPRNVYSIRLSRCVHERKVQRATVRINRSSRKCCIISCEVKYKGRLVQIYFWISEQF